MECWRFFSIRIICIEIPCFRVQIERKHSRCRNHDTALPLHSLIPCGPCGPVSPFFTLDALRSLQTGISFFRLYLPLSPFNSPRSNFPQHPLGSSLLPLLPSSPWSLPNFNPAAVSALFVASSAFPRPAFSSFSGVQIHSVPAFLPGC